MSIKERGVETVMESLCHLPQLRLTEWELANNKAWWRCKRNVPPTVHFLWVCV